MDLLKRHMYNRSMKFNDDWGLESRAVYSHRQQIKWLLHLSIGMKTRLIQLRTVLHLVILARENIWLMENATVNQLLSFSPVMLIEQQKIAP